MQYPAQVQTTIELLESIGNARISADVTASQFFRNRRYIGSKDRKVISELAFSLIRQRDKLEWWAKKMKMPSHCSRTHVILGLIFSGEYQKYDFVSVFSGEKYQPALLSGRELDCIKKLTEQNIDHPSMPEHVLLNVPEWSFNKLSVLFKNDLHKHINALNQNACLDLRVNTLRVDRNMVLQEFKKLGWDAMPTAFSPIGIRLKQGVPLSSTPFFQNGWVDVQDEGSQIVSLLCDAKPGHAVLDMCAGAGGKSLALAATMQNKGRLFATDLSVFRLSKAKERFRRAGVSNHEIRVLDAQGLQWLGRQAERFDRVLVDVPCSGSGTWRRNPDLKWRFQEAEIKELQQKQKTILKDAAKFVKPGGLLIYVTCSLYEDEDEQQIEQFLENHQQFSLFSCRQAWQDCFNTPYPGESDMLKLTPLQHETDGFFMAIIRKNA